MWFLIYQKWVTRPSSLEAASIRSVTRVSVFLISIFFNVVFIYLVIFVFFLSNGILVTSLIDFGLYLIRILFLILVSGMGKFNDFMRFGTLVADRCLFPIGLAC